MNVSRLVLQSPDDNSPSGGVRMIYTIVDRLRGMGVESFVWHRTRDFTCTWFDHETPTIHGSVLDLPAETVLVVPEYLVDPRIDPVPEGRSVILSQNHFYSFHRRPAWEWATTYPGWVSAAAVWATSHAIERTIHRISELPVSRVPYAIDRDLFAPRAKTKTIVMMPRKRRLEADLIFGALHEQLERRGWTVRLVDKLSETDTARALGEAAIFISLAEREGLGLPALEALAAGCAVVGFHGHGGSEYLTGEVGWPVGDGDIDALIDAVMTTVEAVEGGWKTPPIVDRMLNERYSLGAQTSALERALAELNRCDSECPAATATHLGDDFDVVASMPVQALKDVQAMLHAERRGRASANQEIEELKAALGEVATEMGVARDRVIAIAEEQANRERAWEGLLNIADFTAWATFPTTSGPTPTEVELIKATGLFDVGFFARGAVEPGNEEPLMQFLEFIGPKCPAPHPLFDPWFLYSGNPRLPLLPLNPLILYLRHGRQFELSTHPLFDTAHYLAANPDVRAEQADPLIHYLVHGASEGRTPSPWFDPVWYVLHAGPDAEPNPLIHFVTEGWKLGLSPSPRFDTLAYIGAYPDVTEADVNPLVHYLVTGRFEGRRVFPVPG